jgi:hypothetical protein
VLVLGTQTVMVVVGISKKELAGVGPGPTTSDTTLGPPAEKLWPPLLLELLELLLEVLPAPPLLPNPPPLLELLAPLLLELLLEELLAPLLLLLELLLEELLAPLLLLELLLDLLLIAAVLPGSLPPPPHAARLTAASSRVQRRQRIMRNSRPKVEEEERYCRSATVTPGGTRLGTYALP